MPPQAYKFNVVQSQMKASRSCFKQVNNTRVLVGIGCHISLLSLTTILDKVATLAFNSKQGASIPPSPPPLGQSSSVTSKRPAKNAANDTGRDLGSRDRASEQIFPLDHDREVELGRTMKMPSHGKTGSVTGSESVADNRSCEPLEKAGSSRSVENEEDASVTVEMSAVMEFDPGQEISTPQQLDPGFEPSPEHSASSAHMTKSSNNTRFSEQEQNFSANFQDMNELSNCHEDLAMSARSVAKPKDHSRYDHVESVNDLKSSSPPGRTCFFNNGEQPDLDCGSRPADLSDHDKVDDFYGLPELGDSNELEQASRSGNAHYSPNEHDNDINGSLSFAEILQRFHNQPLSSGMNLGSIEHNDQYDSDHFGALEHRKPLHESSLFFAERSMTPSLPHHTEIADAKDEIIVIKDESPSSDLEILDLAGASSQKKSRKTRGGSSVKPSSKKAESRVTKPLQKKSSGRPRGQRGRKRTSPQTRGVNLHGLFHNDIITQATANQGLGHQPILAGNNRQAALKQLIASLPEDQQDLYRGDKIDLDEAAKVFVGRGRKVTAMKADGEAGWLLRGMKSHLQHHQLLGASFMRRREIDGSPYGGVIGDVMGFGKTVICLANLVDGMPLDNHIGGRATLIVVPSALMTQWRTEIDKHVHPETFRHIMIYGPGNRLTGCNDKQNLLAKQDVVITSYHEVMSSYPINQPPIYLTTDRARQEWWEKYLEENKGVLHRVNWHRVVLDESQVIKNHLSRTSIAARALEGKFRWVLSGTPVLNNLKEWYGTLDFLKLPHIGSYDLFCRNFCRKGSEKSLQRLQVTLDKIMLRRTHESKLFGRPIVQLPPIKPVKTVEVAFNSVERAIYTIVLDRFCKRLTPLGTTEQNYRSIFVLLLRLRQLVGHPLLIQKTLRDLLEAEDLEQLWFLTDPSATHNGEAAIDGSKETAQALENALSRMSASEELIARQKLADNQLSIELRRYLQDLRDKGDWLIINQRSMCHSCGSPPETPKITQCKHIYCKSCLERMIYHARVKGDAMASCLSCGSMIVESATWYATAFDEASKGRKSVDSTSAEEEADFLESDGRMLRSAKIHACAEQLRNWFSQDITNKVIIFVQFRGLMKILSRVMEEEHWEYETFDGSMSFDSRNKAIRAFTENPETMVLIAALKAGGIGLNLTAANKIVIIDVWWNQLTEDQAFSRAYRIGQEREVEVVRFVVKNTIDTKIVDMQKRKTLEINSALREENRAKLSLSEMKALWGELHRDREIERAQDQRSPSVESFVPPDDPYDRRINSGDVALSGTESTSLAGSEIC